MPATFYVDQARSFQGVMFLSSAPKLKFGSQQQDTNADGQPRWEVQCVVSYEQFGRRENEILKIGVVGPKDPGEALNFMPQPVELVNFRVGVMPVKTEKTRNRQGIEVDKTTGGTAFYQADEIRSLAAVPGQAKTATKISGEA